MDYRKFLGKKEELVLPYVGGTRVWAPGRLLRITQQVAPGWWRFSISGRSATPIAQEEAPPLGDADRKTMVRGHLLSDRLVSEGARAEPVSLLPADEPPLFAPCTARRWQGGPLVFQQLEFEGDVEEQARRALEDGRALPASDVKGVPATLRAAFGYALAETVSRRLQIPVTPPELRGEVLSITEGGAIRAEQILRGLQAERDQEIRAAEARQAAFLTQARLAQERAEQERLAQEQSTRDRQRVAAAHARQTTERQVGQIPRRGGPDRQHGHDPIARAEAALEAAGAEPLRVLRRDGGMLEVTYRFLGERYVSMVDGQTLQVIDAGICLAGADRMVTLESLPSVIREAVDTDVLVVTWRGRMGGS